MREFPRIKWSALDVVAANGHNTRDVQILSCVGCDESRLGDEIGMQQIEWRTLVFTDDQLEPVYQRIVDAFVRAEPRNVDAYMRVCPLFGRGQV